jgi:hypothetical protein
MTKITMTLMLPDRVPDKPEVRVAAPAPVPDQLNLWFYVAMGALGVTALSLISLILVAAVKIRKSRRQVGPSRSAYNVS